MITVQLIYLRKTKKQIPTPTATSLIEERMLYLNTVINAIRLFFIICLGLPFFLGQGWLIVAPVLHQSLTTKKREYPLLQEILLALLSGVILNYAINLCVQSLQYGLWIGFFLSLLGLFCFFLYFFHYHSLKNFYNATSIIKWLGISFVCFLFISPILSLPLTDWDARFIWFLHAKMIYVANSLGQSAGWQNPSIAFSHPDYPILIPALAAQVAYVMGFWNEYIPKISLFFMLVPAIIGLFSFYQRSFSFGILILLIPFSFSKWIWNGYMDGYLALYFSIALLLIGRYIKLSQAIDVISAFCCLIVLLYIKNEGALLGIIGIFPIILIIFAKEKSISTKHGFLTNWRYYLVGLMALLPFVLWDLYKRQWGISNDLAVGTIQFFSRIVTRLSDGSYPLIVVNLFKQAAGSLLLLGSLYIVSIAQKKWLVKESLPALCIALIYAIVLFIVYLSTPYDLLWHLNTSVDRTMLPVNGGIIVGSYYILNQLESNFMIMLNKRRKSLET